MQKNLNVLLIDDEDHLQEVLGLLLEIDGHSVKTVYTGQEAFEKLKESNFDLVITDLKMPGISGLDVIKKIKESNPEIKIIMITGFPAEEVEKRAKEYGADAFIPKPFHMDVMRKAIDNIFSKK